MSLQTKLYTLNALSTELGHDRRSLGKWLDNLPPAETAADGTRRWRMRDVLDHLATRRATPTAGTESPEEEMSSWVAHKLVPAIFGSETFVRTFTGGMRAELGLSKGQTLRAYMLVLLALAAELERAGISCGIELPPLAEQIAKEGFDAVVARWPDSPRG